MTKATTPATTATAATTAITTRPRRGGDGVVSGDGSTRVGAAGGPPVRCSSIDSPCRKAGPDPTLRVRLGRFYRSPPFPRVLSYIRDQVTPERQPSGPDTEWFTVVSN